MQVCTFDSGLTDVCVCTIICIQSLFWEEGNLCENGFCSSLCLAARAVMKLFHEQNQASVKINPGNACIHLLTQQCAAVSYILQNFQFLLRVWGPCFDFNMIKTCGFIFCLSFFVLKIGLCLPCYRRNLCYLWCKPGFQSASVFLWELFPVFPPTKGCVCTMWCIALLSSVLKRIY